MPSSAESFVRRQVRLTEHLLRALDAGALDDPVVRRVMAHPTPLTLLLRATALARLERWPEARADVARALEMAPDRAIVQLAAGCVLWVTHDHAAALRHLERAAGLDSRAALRSNHLRATLADSLGWGHEVARIRRDALGLAPEDGAWAARLGQLHAQARDHEAAARWLTLSLQRVPRELPLQLALAETLLELGRPEAALAELDDAQARLDLDTEEGARRGLEVALLRVDAGDLTTAAELLERLAPREPEARATLVALDLWRGDPAAARARLRAWADLPALTPSALHRARGIIAMLEARPEDAIGHFSECLVRDPRDAEAWVWRAEAEIALGDDEAAHASLNRAAMAAPGYLFVAWILRYVLVAREARPPDPAPQAAHRLEEFRDAVLELGEEARRVLAEGDEHEVATYLREVLSRMRGNRSTRPTFAPKDAVAGAPLPLADLTRFRARTGCRHASRRALQLIRVRSVDEALAALDEVIARFPDSHLPLCHRGELRYWAGDLQGARRDLEDTLARFPNTRWAWIGLAGIEMHEGQLERSLQTQARGVKAMGETEGPAVFAYRGEALRRLGRLDEAIEDLERARRESPGRVSAAINLHLAVAARASLDDVTRRDALFREIRASIPGLVSEAGEAVGIHPWPEAGDVVPAGPAQVELAEQMLTMMRGNRSSTCITYFTPTGTLRHCLVVRGGAPGPRLHDQRLLESTRGLIRRALASYGEARASLHER